MGHVGWIHKRRLPMRVKNSAEVNRVNAVMNDVFDRLRGHFVEGKIKYEFEQGDESPDVSHVFVVYLNDGSRITLHKSIAESKHRFVEINIDDASDELQFPESCPSIYCDGEIDDSKLKQMESMLDRFLND